MKIVMWSILLFLFFLTISACEETYVAETIEKMPEDVGNEAGNEVTVLPYLKKVKPSSQGMTIFNDKIFVLSAGGHCDIYDFEYRQYESSFDLASSSKTNHCNCANWGVETPSDTRFPLLYVTNGQPGSPTEWHCKVEKILFDGITFSSECVQTIILDPSQFNAYNYLLPWGCPQWLVDRERGYLWVWSAIIRTLPSTTGDYGNNIYHATKFRIPKLSEGKEVILTADDVLDQIPFEFDAYSTQGGCMFDGKIVYLYGFGNNSSPSKIRIYDTDSKTILKKYDLMGVLDVELEDVAVYNNKLYINTDTSILYEIIDNAIFNCK